MAIDEIHKGDIGTAFKLTIKDDDNEIVDLSTCTKKEIIIKNYNKKMIKDATFSTDGTDGIVEYTTIEDDLSQTGNSSIQFVVELDGKKWHSDIIQFTVFENI